MRYILLLVLALGLASCGDSGSGNLSSLARGAMSDFVIAHDRPMGSTAVFVDGNGNEHTLADYRGQVVLVNIWATWCAPCVREMPQLDALQERYGSDHFTVIAISTDRRPFAEVEQYLREDIGAAHLPLFMDQNVGFTISSQVSVWPTTILYDREGRELGRVSRDAEWDSADAHRLIEAAIAQGQDE